MLLLLAIACAGPDPSDSGTAPPPTATATAAPDPLRSFAIAPGDPAAPAAALATLGFDRPVAVDLHGTDGRHEMDLHRDAATDHEIPLVGLYAASSWTFTGTASDGTDAWELPARTFTTPPLPSPFPYVALRSSDPAAMAPGWTLTPLTAADVAGYIVAFDADAEVAWWYELPEPRVLEAFPTKRGTLLFLWDYREIREIDWLGHTVRSVTSLIAGPDQTLPVATAEFQHELLEDADGDWVTLSAGVKLATDFPTSYDDPDARGDALVTLEPIVKIDPDSGTITGTWDPASILQPDRIGYDSLGVLAGTSYDWNHTNAVADAGDAWLVSLRHQDAVVKIAKSDGSLQWILGNEANWDPAWAALRLQPVGDLRWPYHQHAVKWRSDGRVLMFDNGNGQASPYTGELKQTPEEVSSRLVEYQVDEAAGTVAQTFSFELSPRVFSQAMGDADWLPNGNVLGCWAYVLDEGGAPISDVGRGKPAIRIVEATREGGVAWDLDVWGLLGEEAPSWHAYRAERVVPPR